MKYMVDRDYRFAPPQVSMLLRLQVDEEKENQDPYWTGYNQAISSAIHFAESEELRVRGVIAVTDGICLDNAEDKERFILALYGAKDIKTDRP
jgi:hypothetical protein